MGAHEVWAKEEQNRKLGMGLFLSISSKKNIVNQTQ